MDGESVIVGDDPFAQLREVFAGRAALLLEDDPDLSEHVAERLLRAGFATVDRVDRGEAALEKAAARAYDVLLLDRMTAGLDGLETLKRLRASDGPSSDAPALMLTALGGERQKVEGLLEGADDYLAKPVG
ncbi:MAG: response regulator transcription factor, partial [Brevundimonas sp.]